LEQTGKIVEAAVFGLVGSVDTFLSKKATKC